MTTDHATEASPPAPIRKVISEPNFDGPPKPIAEFAGRDDFPKCAFGEHVDIGGYSGVLVEIVNHSIKVRSQEGATQSFNIYRLRKLYGPALRPESEDLSRTAEQPAHVDEATEPPPATPKREFITEPNFSAPIKPITELAGRSDFPQCAFGEHVNIDGYTGVVVEIVKQSLKVACEEGATRSYNAAVLRKLYGQT